MPDVVGELRVQAVPKLQALGLTVNVVMTADDAYCDNLNHVVAQSPSAGTFRLPGATAVIWVAQRPPNGCL